MSERESPDKLIYSIFCNKSEFNKFTIAPSVKLTQ